MSFRTTSKPFKPELIDIVFEFPLTTLINGNLTDRKIDEHTSVSESEPESRVILEEFRELTKRSDDAKCQQFVIAHPTIHKMSVSFFSDCTPSYALGMAMNEDHIMTIYELIRQGANPNTIVYNRSILEAVAMMRVPETDQSLTIALLLEQKCDVNLMANYGNTALMTAVIHNRTAAVMQLLTAKADVNITNSLGNTALIEAVRYGDKASVQLLIEHKCDINIMNNDGYTALMEAVKYGNGTPIIQLLIEHKCDINIMNSNGDTALITAIKHHAESTVMQLLDAKADVNICSPLKASFDKSSTSKHFKKYMPQVYKSIGLELMRRGADFVSIIDTSSECYVDIDKGRGPFAKYIHTVYTEQIFAVLCPFFGITYCRGLGDLIAGYLSFYAI